MSRSTVHSHSHSAKVRAEMKALDLAEPRTPLAIMLLSLGIASANAASVIAMLMSL